MRSPRAAEILRRAVLVVVDRQSETWESSDGTVRAVDVTVRIDGFASGLLASRPAAHDAVVEAVAAVAPSVLGASVIDLRFEWALRERPAEEGYRDDTPELVDRESSRDVQRALAAFLHASGDEASARQLILHIRGSRIVVLGVPLTIAEPALAALFGGPVHLAGA